MSTLNAKPISESMKEFEANEVKANEAKVNEAKANPKMIGKMITAIEKEDEKTLLKFMAMDKKGFFNKNSLDFEAEEGNVTAEEAKKLGILSIGVALMLDSLTGDKTKKEAKKKAALDRVKEVK